MRVVCTLPEDTPVIQIARSPLNMAYYDPINSQPPIAKTALEIVDYHESRIIPANSKWIQVVVFSLTREANRKRKQNRAAKKEEDSDNWDVEIHGIGHLTYMSPHEGVETVRNRVLDRIPTHFRHLMLPPSSRPAIIHKNGKAAFLKPLEWPPWHIHHEIPTSPLYAQVVRRKLCTMIDLE